MTGEGRASGAETRGRLERLRLAPMVLLLLLAVARPVGATIRYRISLRDGDTHRFHVQMRVPARDEGVVVALPAWNALYQIRDFSYRVRDLRATLEANPDKGLALRMLDKQTWRIAVPRGRAAPDNETAVISYSVEWNDPGPFDSQLNAHHAFVNLAEVLMYVPSRRAEDVRVSFEDVPPGWRIAAELAPGAQPDSYTAGSYDALVDAPVEAGKFSDFVFESGGARFRVVVDAADSKRARLEEPLRRITGYELRLMGGPPFSEYTFFFHLGGYADVGGGGMEHANSTAIAASSEDRAAAVAAHEFFHAWNVKRIRPQSLEPVDYAREQYTRSLWFAEGVTSAYAAYTLERTGLWSKNQFYDDLAAQIAELATRPARFWQSAEESSLEAWFEKYPAYAAPDRSISYYNKGQILGVLLDLAIRDATNNRQSLDDVLRRMNVKYARAGKLYPGSEGIRAMVEEVAGKSFADFFRRYVSGTEEIPYNDFLSPAGLSLRMDLPLKPGGSAAIVEIPHPTARQRRIRDGLLRGVTE